jgi:zinc transport system ATP-binding protein
VSIGYEQHPVLTELDFVLARGEVVAVLGPNGSGKSTLIRGVLGLAHVQAGHLELFGIPAARFRQWHRLGYVPQRHTVAGRIPVTVREVVSSGRLNRIRPWRRFTAADQGAIEGAIDTVGLAGRDRDLVATLSGGQQRRVLIARALAADPEVLILDEPTAGVDLASQQALAATLAGLAEAGTTILVVTHELGPLEPIITRTVVVRDGRIGYDGPPVTGAPVEGADHHHPHGEPPVRPGMGLAGHGETFVGGKL